MDRVPIPRVHGNITMPRPDNVKKNTEKQIKFVCNYVYQHFGDI